MKYEKDPYTDKIMKCFLDECNGQMFLSGPNEAVYQCRKCKAEFDRVVSLELYIDELRCIISNLKFRYETEV